MKLFVVIVLSLTVLSLANNIPEFVKRGHFAGRSGNVVVSPQALASDKSPSVLVVDQYRQHHTFSTAEDTIQDINIANLVSHIFQTAPPSNEGNLLEIDRSAFPVVSLFHPPAANAFVIVEGVDYDILDRYPTLSLLKGKKQVEIVPTYYHKDTLSSAETIVTSSPPSVHGITGSSWINYAGLESMAFYDGGSESHAESFFDSLSMTSPNSLMVSMSSDYQLASVLGVRVPDYVQKANHATYFWNSQHQTFDVKQGARFANKDLKSNRACILNSFQDSANFLFNYENIIFKFDEKVMQLHVSSISSHMNDVVYDMNAEEDFIIFAELHFLETLLNAMKGEDHAALLKDSAPDAFNLGFAGLNSLKEKYGAESPQFIAALHLLDSALSAFFDSMNSLYFEKLSHQVVFLRTPPAVPYYLTESLLSELENSVVSAGDLTSYLPEIYLENTNGNEQDEISLLSSLNEFLQIHELSAYWFGNLQVQSQDLVLGENAPRRWSIKVIFGGKRKPDSEKCYTLDEVSFAYFWTLHKFFDRSL